MAIWQYNFHIFTKESYEAFYASNSPFFSDEEFDDERLWSYKPTNLNIFDDIDLFLKREQSWSKFIVLFGLQESNCLEVYFDAYSHIVTSVSLKIDFTTQFESLLTNIIHFLISNQLVLLDENYKVISFDIGYIKEVIFNSPQKNLYDRLLNS